MTRRGFTLIELLISLAVMMVAVAAATELLVAGMTMSRNAEVLTEDLDNARMAGNMLAKDVQAAGLFAPRGIYVWGGTSPPTKINAVWSVSGSTNSPDQLFVVTPMATALTSSCTIPGAAVPVSTVAAGVPSINCNSGSLTAMAAGDPIMISNLNTASLLFGTTLTSSGSVTTIGATNLTSFSDTGASGVGYQQGDLAYKVNVWRYFIATQALTGRPALYRHRQVPASTAAVFADAPSPATDELVQSYIEDLQVAFMDDSSRSGDPSQYAVLQSYGPTWTGTERSARVTVVAVGERANVDTRGAASTVLAPMKVEDHTVVGPADGYRRTQFVQRIELPNAAPENL